MSEFLDFHLKSVRQENTTLLDYIKDTTDFQDKIKNMSVPKDAVLVTLILWVYYPHILHEVGLKLLNEALNRRKEKEISSDNLVKITEFVLKNQYLQFYRLETSFLEIQTLKPLPWICYIDNIWTHIAEKLK